MHSCEFPMLSFTADPVTESEIKGLGLEYKSILQYMPGRKYLKAAVPRQQGAKPYKYRASTTSIRE